VRRGETGAALLEALTALAILGTAGVALVGQVRQAGLAASQVHSAEREFVEASEFLDMVSLWPRSDLDRHLGNRRNGPWRLAVYASPGGLYEVAVRDSSDRKVFVATSLYRIDDGDVR
jgi:hypothetical protein